MRSFSARLELLGEEVWKKEFSRNDLYLGEMLIYVRRPNHFRFRVTHISMRECMGSLTHEWVFRLVEQLLKIVN